MPESLDTKVRQSTLRASTDALRNSTEPLRRLDEFYKAMTLIRAYPPRAYQPMQTPPSWKREY